ncbi:MAG TPA: DUF6799 domain-containing protein [Chthoniobacteraceae bacterium]|jgi:hypothetical protein
MKAFPTLLTVIAAGALALPGFAADEKSSTGTSQTASASAGTQNGIAKIDGNHWLVRDGKKEKQVTKDSSLPGGMMIHGDGKVMIKGGKTVELKEGQWVNQEGKVDDAPAALKTSAASGASSGAAASSTATSTGNKSGSSTAMGGTGSGAKPEDRETTEGPGNNTSNSGKAIQGRSATETGDK